MDRGVGGEKAFTRASSCLLLRVDLVLGISLDTLLFSLGFLTNTTSTDRHFACTQPQRRWRVSRESRGILPGISPGGRQTSARVAQTRREKGGGTRYHAPTCDVETDGRTSEPGLY